MKKSIVLLSVLSIFLNLTSTAFSQSTPPKLIADSTQNDINHPIGVSFTKDSTWAANIEEIWINGREVHFSYYQLFEDSIVLLPDVFISAGTNNIIVRALGYKDAIFAQELDEGGIWNNTISSISPADNSFHVESETSLVLNFENNVTLNEGSIRIFKIEYQTDDGLYELISSSSENVTGNGTKQITITSSKGFKYGSYYIMIDDNVFGENFKGFNHTYDWTFTTGYMLDELIPGVSLGHDVRLTISIPASFYENETDRYPGIFILDAPWFTGLHTSLHIIFKNDLIPLDPVVITIGPKYEKDIIEIRELDYTQNYDKFYDFLKYKLVPYATREFNIDPTSRILEGASYAGFMTLYSFFQSCIQQDTTFSSFVPSSPVLRGYYSMMDYLSENADSLGKNLSYFVAEFDLDVCLPVHPLLNSWVKENSFSYFNYYDEIDKGKDHYTSAVNAFIVSSEIILNLPKPYFAFSKYNYSEEDTTRYTMRRRWPKDGTLSGNGVVDTCFIPSIAGKGIHTITYTYTDEQNQTYTREREVNVGNVGIEEHRLQTVQVYPNPSSGSTLIRFELAESLPVHLSIFNLLGQEQVVLLSEDRHTGQHEVQFDASQLNSGVYFVRLVTDKLSTCKLIVQ